MNNPMHAFKTPDSNNSLTSIISSRFKNRTLRRNNRSKAMVDDRNSMAHRVVRRSMAKTELARYTRKPIEIIVNPFIPMAPRDMLSWKRPTPVPASTVQNKLSLKIVRYRTQTKGKSSMLSQGTYRVSGSWNANSERIRVTIAALRRKPLI
jgi:hypothetical protein